MNKTNLEKMIADTYKTITLISKKTKQKIDVVVVWHDKDENTLCGRYINKYGKPAIKEFDMTQYDISS